MEKHEMAENLVQKCGITYEEAANVLREANYDLLEAMIILERQGKLRGANTFSTQSDSRRSRDKTAADAESFAELVKIAWGKFCCWLREIMKYQVIVTKNEREIMRFPLAPAVLIFCCTAGFAFAVVIISILSGCSFTVRKVQ